MATNRKYITVRTRDLRELLNDAEQRQMLELMTAIATRRAERNPTMKVPTYFTLNAADKYAVPAIEAYIAAIDADTINIQNAGVIEARAAASAVREYAIMTFDGTKLPS